ncbi:MAG: cytochrome c [Candidatus Thiodiazotropha sp. (ex. Lucinoma kazani)]
MIKTVIPATILILVATSSQAADPGIGKKLNDEHCVKCHGSEVYTRTDRRVTSLPGLHKQVRFCEQNLGLTWFDDDVANTATYLNLEYYKFNQNL